MSEQALAEYQQPKHPGGKPPLYTSPVTLQEQIDDYFTTCDKGRLKEVVTKKGDVITVTEQIPYTVAGLAYHLGFASTQSLFDYSNRNENSEQYASIIARAKLKIQAQRWDGGLTGSQDAKIVQFDLMCNHGHNPAQVLEINQNVTLSVDQLTQQARSLLAQASPEQLRILGVDKVDDVIDVKALPVPDKAKVNR